MAPNSLKFVLSEADSKLTTLKFNGRIHTSNLFENDLSM